MSAAYTRPEYQICQACCGYYPIYPNVSHPRNPCHCSYLDYLKLEDLNKSDDSEEPVMVEPWKLRNKQPKRKR